MLVEDPSKVINQKDDALISFFRENIELLDDLRIAYIASRYLPFKYSKAKAERLVGFAEDAIKILDKL